MKSESSLSAITTGKKGKEKTKITILFLFFLLYWCCFFLKYMLNTMLLHLGSSDIGPLVAFSKP